MANELDIVELGAGKLDPDTGLPLLRAVVTLSTEGDVEEFGDLDNFCALGVTSLPFPKTDEGVAEGIVATNIGGTDGVIVGARDERCAEVYGNMVAGDAALHSVDPDASAQCLCKGVDRQVILLSKDTNGDNMAVVVDGKNNKIQVTAFGAMIEISPDGSVSMAESGGASITLKGGDINLMGRVLIGGGPFYSPAMMTATPLVPIPVVGGVVGGVSNPNKVLFLSFP